MMASSLHAIPIFFSAFLFAPFSACSPTELQLVVSVGEVDVSDGGPHVAAPVTHFALLEGGAPTLGKTDFGAEVKLPAGGGELEGAAPALAAAPTHTPAPGAQHQPRAPAAWPPAAICGKKEAVRRAECWRALYWEVNGGKVLIQIDYINGRRHAFWGKVKRVLMLT